MEISGFQDFSASAIPLFAVKSLKIVMIPTGALKGPLILNHPLL
jgi:hypothetical protein